MSGQAASTPLSVRAKFTYGLGTVAFGIKDQGLSALLMLYYNQVVGLPAAWVGAAIMIVMIVDALADPLIGHLSDHLRSPWGRRHPFMYASALPLAIAYYLLWTPPAGSHELQFAWLLVTAAVVRLAVACYEIPSSTLMVEFTDDYNERTSLATYRSLCYALGSIGMSVITLNVILKGTPEQPIGQLNPEGYGLYGTVCGLLMFACILFSAWGTHHRIPLLRAHVDTERLGFAAFWSGIREIITDRALASVLLCMLLFGLGGGFATTIGTYVNTYYWQLNSGHMATLAGSSVWGVMLALVFVQLSKSFGKKQTTLLLYGIALGVLCLPVGLGLLGLIPRDIPSLMPWLIGAHIVLIMCVLAALILGSSLGADVGDHLQLKTGRRMEGLMFATVVMVNKAVSGLGVFLSGLALAAMDFPDKASPATVTEGMASQLALVYLCGMAGFFSLAILALSRYPITRESHARTVEALRARQEQQSCPPFDSR